jgi:hypothetical protein
MANDRPIRMTNGSGSSTDSAERVAADLLDIFDFIAEREETLFACDCEDGETPAGYMESDTGAYIHGPKCPTAMQSHVEIILASVIFDLDPAQLAALRLRCPYIPADFGTKPLPQRGSK